MDFLLDALGVAAIRFEQFFLLSFLLIAVLLLAFMVAAIYFSIIYLGGTESAPLERIFLLDDSCAGYLCCPRNQLVMSSATAEQIASTIAARIRASVQVILTSKPTQWLVQPAKLEQPGQSISRSAMVSRAASQLTAQLDPHSALMDMLRRLGAIQHAFIL
jgi:hypothetical protein